MLMPWPKTRIFGLAWLATSTAFAPALRAAVCESPRPTSTEARGVSYGGAKLDFYDSASGRARVHYALSGSHAPPATATIMEGIPDAVVVAAQAADAALDKYAELGYVAPLSDASSPCDDNGGSDAVDIYVIHFTAADGQAGLDHCEDGSPQRCAGFVLVENDFRGGGYADVAEGLRTVVPHELFHLVQDAYDAGVERWWAEGSAQWAAKQVYPELEDLERFLPGYFDNPWRPLNVPPSGIVTNFLYATAIWPVFLHEHFDAQLVREVFEGFGQGTKGVLPVTDDVLQARGSNLGEQFLQFAAYNAATGKRAAKRTGYEQAAAYPEVPVAALGAGGVSDVASGLGAYYYSVPAGSYALDADPSRMAALLLPLVDGKVDLSAASALPATASGDAIVVVAGQSVSRTDAPFTLSPATTLSETETEPSGCSLTAPGADTKDRNGYAGILGLFGLACALGKRLRPRCTKH